MKLISIDVGMKNLAYCLMEVNTNDSSGYINNNLN